MDALQLRQKMLWQLGSSDARQKQAINEGRASAADTPEAKKYWTDIANGWRQQAELRERAMPPDIEAADRADIDAKQAWWQSYLKGLDQQE